MNDSWANIDLIFRNGLKNYEVLPPPEVWNNIKPVIGKKQKPYVVLRAAAMIAVILSLTFLAYRWSIEISSRLEIPVLASGEESVAPASNPVVVSLVPVRNLENKISGTDAGILNEVPAEEIIIPADNLEVTGEISSPSISGKIALFGTAPGNYNLMTRNLPEVYKILYDDFTSPEMPVVSAKDETSKWTIAALIGPTYYTSFRTGNDDMAKQILKSEQPVFSYSGGVALSYKINKRFSVQSGLYYSSIGQVIEGISAFSGFQKYDNTKGDRNFTVLTANGKVYTNNSDVFLLDNGLTNRVQTRFTNEVFDPVKAELQYLDNSLRQNFSYLELPFIVKYKVIDKTLDFNLIGGLSSNLLVNNSVYVGGKFQVAETDGLNPITFSGSLGMGMEYNISDKLSLNMEPTFRYYLNPFNEFSGLRFHPYSFGVLSGLSFKF